jgi:hypothetical protein
MASRSLSIAVTTVAALFVVLCAFPAGNGAALVDQASQVAKAGEASRHQLLDLSINLGGLKCKNVIRNTAGLERLLAKLEKKGLTIAVGLLRSSPEVLSLLADLLVYAKVTLLLPSNEALLAIDATVLANLKANPALLAAFLKAHILAVRLPGGVLACLTDGLTLTNIAGQLITKVAGGINALVTLKLNVAGAAVVAIVKANIFVNNLVVVHVLANVLVVL